MNESISARAILILLASLVLSACAGMSEGPVPVSESTSTELEGLRTAIREECLDVSNATAPPGSKARRTELVTAFMTAADLSYNNYERDLLAFTRDNDLGGSLANQLLSAIGAASGSRAISRATNITSGAVSGAQSAFAKSLLNQTVSVIQTHMRAQRATQYALIVERLSWPYESYNTCMAFSDALAYEQAGTLNAALAAMAASATDQERRGDANADRAIRRVLLATDTLATALDAYLNPADEAVGEARREAARAIVSADNILPNSELSVPERYSMIVYDGDRAVERAELARKLVDRDPQGAANLSEALN
ncbi:MAG TPA: hypothetical protein VEW71_06850 [Allosphingosinicella sp.]|nr:hypothetical protein [Allosphingosinicella sp.]